MSETHAAVPTPSSLLFCTCHQGFSGANAAERLQAHIENPNPKGIGAMLIELMS